MMSTDGNSTCHKQDQMWSLDEIDESDVVSGINSSHNILEHFPYLRNDGLGQIQAQHQLSTAQCNHGNNATISANMAQRQFLNKKAESPKMLIINPNVQIPRNYTYRLQATGSNSSQTGYTYKLQATGTNSLSQTVPIYIPSKQVAHGTRSVTDETGVGHVVLNQNLFPDKEATNEKLKDSDIPVTMATSTHNPSKIDRNNVCLESLNHSTSFVVVNGRRRERHKVQYVLKGRLGHDMDSIVKSVQQIMIEPVDREESFVEDFVYNYSDKVKNEPTDEFIKQLREPTVRNTDVLSSTDVSGAISIADTFPHLHTSSLQNTNGLSIATNTLTRSSISTVPVMSILLPIKSEAYTKPSIAEIRASPIKSEANSRTTGRYTEPSIAEIRASVLCSSSCLQDISRFEAELDDGGNYAEDEMIGTSIINEDNFTDDENNESGIDENNAHENWNNAAMKQYPYIKLEDDVVEYTPSAKKGGRSDPENPFALTSPSFSESTAKAIMTTTQTSTATIVMISIMSIGSREKLIPRIVNSKGAEGGLVSIINPIEDPLDKKTQVDGIEQIISSDRTPIMSKLKREKSPWNENDSANVDIDRLDVNIKIDDIQFVGTSENKRWLCKICPKSYTTKHNLVAHILDHSDIKPHLCLICEKYFKQLSHLNTHMLTHDNVRPYICTICDKGFTQVSHLKRHETVHMGSKPYICDICKRGFTFPSELRLHKEKHTSGGEKCTDCEEEFDTWRELHEHMVTSNHCSDLQCKHCERIYRFPSQLRDHMLSHVGSRPYICTECGMDFMKEHHLKSHQFTHTGLRPYACHECGRSFNQKANMQRHMLIHNAKRAYRCEVCSKTFTQPQTLKAHMVVHSDTKPYKCNICGKQFGRQHNLQGHIHIHSDSKPYTCSICQSSFTLKGNLNRHKKVKHGLDESTETMEEDAVNFLSTLSDRARDGNYTQSDLDIDSRDDLSSPESRSNRKGRKSAPKKHVSKDQYLENNDRDTSSDIETEVMISYSDEERENERTKELRSQYSNQEWENETIRELTSKYFESHGNDSSRRKRKRGVVHKVENDNSDCENDHKDECKIEKHGNGDTNGTATAETRSVRKRKKKDYGQDFTETGLYSL